MAHITFTILNGNAKYEQMKDVVGVSVWKNLTERSSILFTGMHKANSAGAHTFAYGMIMDMIRGFVQGDLEIQRFLANSNVYVIPCLNIDGYSHILTSGDVALYQYY